MQQAGIVFDENIVGVWFISCEQGDLMVALRRDGERLQIKGRVRTYVDKVVTSESQDRKRWFEGAPPTLELGLAQIRGTVAKFNETFVLFGGVKDNVELLRGDDESYDDFVARFMVQPWAHAQPITEGENQHVH